ncbi:F0F1 ATP synthase subunit A [Candidatus Gracilibacteria bacterium]|nr:F0F1 ATP synthase subunit A [Candidatus Gracilibacteria bacterium]
MKEIQNNELQTESHAGPHIPKIQGEQVYGPISNTNVSTFIFLILILIFGIFARNALKREKSRLKTGILNFIGFIDKNLIDSFHGDKLFARSAFPLIAGFLIVILFGNLFGLIIDWLGGSISSNILEYLRPMNSDLNTTLVLGLITVVVMLGITLKHSGVSGTIKGYLFNFSGKTFSEKCINVFVGWLHLISVPSTVASLSLRLFGNIFAGVILIGVISYLGVLMSSSLFEVGRFVSIPFWFFEIFVAFIQAAVFYMLMISYFNQGKESHH